MNAIVLRATAGSGAILLTGDLGSAYYLKEYENVSDAVMATIKDVAKAANLSVTTASRALNNHSDVAERTRAHVHRVAAQLGYHPNHTARSLQGTRTNT